MLRGLTTARSVALTMAGSTMKCSVPRRSRSSSCQRVGMGAHRDGFQLAQVVQQRLPAAAALDEGVPFAQQHLLRVLHRGQEIDLKVDAPAVQRLR